MSVGKRTGRSALGDERRLTESLAQLYAPVGRGRRPVVGIGDDAAVLPVPPGDPVVCCDPVVEGVHFTSGTAPRRIAHKAVHRNLSDLAAMGAVADWLAVSVLLPTAIESRSRDELFRGLRDAARDAECLIVGGDVGSIGTSGPLVVTVTAIGHMPAGVTPLCRDRARVGDELYVTGPLGGSAHGHHLRFRARMAEGAWLARQRGVEAAIDVSDGLAIDVATVLEASSRASGVELGVVIDAAAVPVRAAARRAAVDRGAALDAALHDGEDHELAFFVARGRALGRGGPLSVAARRPIGHVVALDELPRGAQRVALRARDGTLRAVETKGFRHVV